MLDLPWGVRELLVRNFLFRIKKIEIFGYVIRHDKQVVILLAEKNRIFHP